MRAIVVALLFVAANAFATDPNGTIVARAAVAVEDKELAEKVAVEDITYVSDGLKIKGFLITPKAGEGKLPCIIWARGGNRDFGAVTPMVATRMLASIAARGYVVVASQYRGGGGSEGADEFGGAEVNDILSLFPLLEKEPRADATRVGLYGWSRGGMMTYLVLAKTDRIRAAVIGGGLSDAFDAVEKRPEMLNVFSALAPNWNENKDAALVSRSAIRWAEKLNKTTPILLMHGTSDWRVDPGQSMRMASKLIELKHPVRLILFEGGDHGLSEWRAERTAAAMEFFDRYVRDGKKWPSTEPHGD